MGWCMGSAWVHGCDLVLGLLLMMCYTTWMVGVGEVGPEHWGSPCLVMVR